MDFMGVSTLEWDGFLLGFRGIHIASETRMVYHWVQFIGQGHPWQIYHDNDLYSDMLPSSVSSNMADWQFHQL